MPISLSDIAMEEWARFFEKKIAKHEARTYRRNAEI